MRHQSQARDNRVTRHFSLVMIRPIIKLISVTHNLTIPYISSLFQKQNKEDIDEKCVPLRVFGSSMSGARDVFTEMQDYSEDGDDWVQEWLDDGGREYCLIDSHTREGRLKIAKYQDKGCLEWIRPLSVDLAEKTLEEIWTEKEDNFEAAGERLGVILYELKNLIDLRGDRCNIMVGCIEGQTRMVSMMTTSYGSHFNGGDGAINPGSLSFRDLELEVRRGEDSHRFEDDDNFQRYVKDILSNNPPPMMSNTVRIEAFHFINNCKSINVVFMCLKVISKTIHFQKKVVRHISDVCN